MFFQRFVCFIFLAFTANFVVNASPVTKFLPEGHQYNTDIATPESVIGFDIGARHPRHDQLVNYFKSLASQSNKVMLTSMGKTPQLREQLLVTISSAENLANIDEILANRTAPHLLNENEPLVIWLGYSVHGDEISGANAAMVVAYHLAASQHASMETMLENTVIVLEPSINPDGMDRFVNWVTNYRNTADNSDANHIEHHQGWITGRTNHFWFDLNRDWLLLTQKESQQRLKYFHQYKPHVLGDFHEMGANGSYFFQPGIPTRNHPLTPKENTELTKVLAGYHAKALDKENRLYYSEENFDDFYYGKGSTYPDINGSIGILFEQASSRGMQQDTINGLLTFEFGIKNHVITSLSTIEGALKNKTTLQQYRVDFYQQAKALAKKEKFSGYLIREAKDKYRLNAFLNKLSQHQIKVYPLAEDFRFNSDVFNKNTSYYVPIAQPQYRMIKALFNQDKNFKDNTFYDVSGWTLPLAMNIEFHQVERTWGLKLVDTPWVMPSQNAVPFTQDAYAYAFDWQQFLAPKLLNELLTKGIQTKVATKAFTTELDGKLTEFTPGSILIPAGIQTVNNWRDIIAQASEKSQINLLAFTTGFTHQGIDLGSGSLKPIKPIKVLLIAGQGISQYEAGEVRYYLDETLNIPLSVIEHQRIRHTDLSRYSHIILVDGNYNNLHATIPTKLESWIKQGGVIFAQKRGAKWLSDKSLLKADFVSNNQLNQLFDTDELTYQDKEALAGRKRIAGAIFEANLDRSHPLAYGFTRDVLPMFRNSTLIMERPSTPFITVAKYSGTPLMSGYTDRNLVNKIAHNAAMIGHNLGKGRVIATNDDIAFRGYWLGSAKLLTNSLFFAKAFNAPIKQ